MTFKNPFYLTPEKSSPDACEGRHFFVKGSLESGLRALPRLQLHRIKSESEICDFFDTHVWSLWFEKAILAREKAWVLQTDGECLKIVSNAVTPKFAFDFPEGKIRTRLGDLIYIRALRKTASVRLERESFLKSATPLARPSPTSHSAGSPPFDQTRSGQRWFKFFPLQKPLPLTKWSSRP